MKQIKTKRLGSVSLLSFFIFLICINSTLWADAKSKYQWEVLQEQKKAKEEGREPKQIPKETSSQRQWRLKKEQEKNKSIK